MAMNTLSCPFVSVIVRHHDELVLMAPLRVRDDRDWTLEERLALPIERFRDDFLIWLSADEKEVLRTPCARLTKFVDGTGYVPAGTSLLTLLSST